MPEFVQLPAAAKGWSWQDHDESQLHFWHQVLLAWCIGWDELGMHFSGRAPFDNFVGAFLDQFWEQWASFRGPFPKTVERLAAAVWPALPASRPNEDLQRMGISEEVFWHSFFSATAAPCCKRLAWNHMESLKVSNRRPFHEHSVDMVALCDSIISKLRPKCSRPLSPTKRAPWWGMLGAVTCDIRGEFCRWNDLCVSFPSPCAGNGRNGWPLTSSLTRRQRAQPADDS